VDELADLKMRLDFDISVSAKPVKAFNVITQVHGSKVQRFKVGE
jgi:hypothetical protein